jgi:RNA polymerase sigma factor (sigma-70 family)
MLRLVRLVHPGPGPSLGAEDDLLRVAEAAMGGDALAGRTLLTALAPHFLRVARRVLGAQHPDVEDVAQECAVEFVSALPRFRRESSVKHFACSVALQAAMNARRRLCARKRPPLDLAQVEADQVAGAEEPPDARAEAMVTLKLVCELCDELPAAQAEALALHFVLGFTVGEVAAVCGAPAETVRSRIRLAKRTLMSRALAHPQLRELLGTHQ